MAKLAAQLSLDIKILQLSSCVWAPLSDSDNRHVTPFITRALIIHVYINPSNGEHADWNENSRSDGKLVIKHQCKL